MKLSDLILTEDRIVYRDESIELNYVKPVGNFEQVLNEYRNSDIRFINNLYQNVRCIKVYSKIIYNENRIGIEANDLLLKEAYNNGIKIKVITEGKQNFVFTDTSIIAIFEDDDDDDPDTGYFYFIGRIN